MENNFGEDNLESIINNFNVQINYIQKMINNSIFKNKNSDGLEFQTHKNEVFWIEKL
jgi:hypothetical protein